MPLDNVVPIDAQTARILEQRTTRFRWFVAGVAALWLALLVPVLLFTPLPPLVPFVVLALLVVLAEHQFVLFEDETSMSASIIVVVGSIFVFADSAPLAAPMLIASLGGLYLPHLRNRAYAKAAFNSACMGLASLVAALPMVLANSSQSSVGVAFVAVAAVLLAYWSANNLLVACYQAVSRSEAFIPNARCLITSDTEILVWAFAACMGIALANGRTLYSLTIVTAIVAARVAVQSSRRSIRRGAAAHDRITPFAIWLAALASFLDYGHPSPGEIAFALVLVTLTARGTSHRGEVLPLLLVAGCVLSVHEPVEVRLLILGASVAVFLCASAPALKWSACVGIGASIWLLVGAISTLEPTKNSSVHGVITTVVVPALITLVIYNATALFTLARRSYLAAAGILVPSARESMIIVMIVTIAIVSRAHFAIGIAAATTFAVLFAMPSRVSDPETEADVSR